MRYVALDSMRGLAALTIVFYHIGSFGWIASLAPFRYGWLLVDFFFVLSGFVIATSYGARLAQGYPRGGFLLVRFGRIYPLHIVTVALFVALEFLVFRPVLHESHPLTELVRAVFLLDAFVRGAGNFYAPVSWAVAVELVLYVFAALLFGRGRWALALAVVLAAASAWALLANFNVIGFGRLLQRGLLGFALGVFCYRLHRRTRAANPGPAALGVAEAALAVTFLWVMWLPGKTASWIPAVDLLFGAMILVFARESGLVSKLLRARPLVRLGQLSFAIYMVHLFFVILPNRFLPGLVTAMGHADWVRPGRHTFGLMSIDPPPAIATLLSLAVLGCAIGTAWLAWRLIEEPALRWTRRFGPNGTQAASP